MTADVLVVGTGLIGTSIALALRSERDVMLSDPDPGALDGARARGAGRVWDGRESAGLVVVCAPPLRIASEVVRLMRLEIGVTVTHVGSVQARVQSEVEASAKEMSRFCGGHPLAGRERSGPSAATAELFAGRTWAICPGRWTSAQARLDVAELAVSVGAHPITLDPDEHDRAVALVSHLPQVAASALAAQLVPGAGTAAVLAGPGLQDSTRVAASDPGLWQQVLAMNAAHLAPLVSSLARDLADVAEALQQLAAVDGVAAGADRPTTTAGSGPSPASVVLDLLRRGVEGRRSVPLKRGERDAAFVVVAVSVVDAPGQLAALLTTAGDGSINVEDVRVDHVPDSPRGVIELLVRPGVRARAVQVLRAAGWDVLGEPA